MRYYINKNDEGKILSFGIGSVEGEEISSEEYQRLKGISQKKVYWEQNLFENSNFLKEIPLEYQAEISDRVIKLQQLQKQQALIIRAPEIIAMVERIL